MADHLALALVLAGAGVLLATVALAVGLALGLWIFVGPHVRRREGLDLPPAARPTPRVHVHLRPPPKAPPGPAADPEAPALLGASAWGGYVDDGETEPEPLAVPGHVVQASAPRRYDPDAMTVHKRPKAPPWHPAARLPGVTLSTTPEGVASELDEYAREAASAAKKLRESQSNLRAPPRPAPKDKKS